MAGGWAALGDALGGNSEQAYQEGLALGAQTQNALAQARARVEEARARSGLADKLVAMGFQPAQADAAATTLSAGGGLGDVFAAALKNQEYGFRERAGVRPAGVAPGSIEDRQFALAGVANGPVDVYRAVGSRGYQNVFDPAAGIMPLGANLADDPTSARIAWANYIEQARQQDPARAQRLLSYDRNLDVIREVGGVPFRFTAGVSGVPSVAPGALSVAPGASSGTPTPGEAPQSVAGSSPTLGTPLATADMAAQNEARIASVKARAVNQAEQAAQLPTIMQASQDFEQQVQGLMADPGFDTIYGRFAGSSVGQAITPFASDAAAGAMTRVNQLRGQAFIQAIQKMRGLGQLSNQEGAKVSEAYTRATQLQQSPDTARAAWTEVLQSIKRMRMALRVQASGALFPNEAAAAQAGLAPGTPIAVMQPDGTYAMGSWE